MFSSPTDKVEINSFVRITRILFVNVNRLSLMGLEPLS
jgi:hypothetical protein